MILPGFTSEKATGRREPDRRRSVSSFQDMPDQHGGVFDPFRLLVQTFTQFPQAMHCSAMTVAWRSRP